MQALLVGYWSVYRLEGHGHESERRGYGSVLDAISV